MQKAAQSSSCLAWDKYCHQSFIVILHFVLIKALSHSSHHLSLRTVLREKLIMTTVNESLREIHDTITIALQTKFLLGPPSSHLKNKSQIWDLYLFWQNLDKPLGFRPVWPNALNAALWLPHLRIHSPCGKKEQPGGEVAGIIELINEPLPLKGRGATI